MSKSWFRVRTFLSHKVGNIKINPKQKIQTHFPQKQEESELNEADYTSTTKIWHKTTNEMHVTKVKKRDVNCVPQRQHQHKPKP